MDFKNIKQAKFVYLDGEQIGELLEFQATFDKEKQLITIKYLANEEEERILSCNISAISFQ